jgi:hypothetical protein
MDYAIYWVCCISANEGGEGAEIVWVFFIGCARRLFIGQYRCFLASIFVHQS